MSDEGMTFAKRFGYSSEPKAITVREDAPPGFRSAVLSLAEGEAHMTPKQVTDLVRRVLGEGRSTDWSTDVQRRDAEDLVERRSAFGSPTSSACGSLARTDIRWK